MKEKWNNRYRGENYYFGKEPNDFLKTEIQKLTPGRALFIGEGEGRNSVYAAKLGWDVDAIDLSEEGMRKALMLAKENSVNINYKIGDALTEEITNDLYDSVILIYFHIHNDLRDEFWKKITSALKTGGSIILLVYDKDNLELGSRGPSDIEMLFTLQDIAETFIDFKFVVFKRSWSPE